MTIAFELQGEQFVALNGGPGFPFTNAVSLVVNCESQEEIDLYWEKLAADGGEQLECGWLKDKFGMPWQIVPGKVWEWLRGEDPAARAAGHGRALADGEARPGRAGTRSGWRIALRFCFNLEARP
jgi:predicted 3-demethylubiquinone-9 3-methyltransferase (glyoxalase superfamily)